MGKALYEWCIEKQEHTLLAQWDTERNDGLSPHDVSFGSHRKLWWSCENGHHWQAAVYARTGGSGCPFCTRRRPWIGKNDLASQNPELLPQWHPTKNVGLAPSQVAANSHKSVWWVCEKGHEWRAQIRGRVNGSGCPVCANRILMPGENDLAATHPELSRQWHPTKNGTLTPGDLMAGTSRKVWWQCEKGHEWQATVASRVSGAGCPVCAGKKIIPGINDFASQFPEIAAQWHPTKNGVLLPSQLGPQSNRKVWWRCPLGHDYQSVVGARVGRDVGCPYCAGRRVLQGFNDLATLEPTLAAQWHPTLNGTLTAELVTTGTNRKVWWECPNGHVWKATIASRARGRKCGCPVCAGKVKESRQLRYASMTAEGFQANVVNGEGRN